VSREEDIPTDEEIIEAVDSCGSEDIIFDPREYLPELRAVAQKSREATLADLAKQKTIHNPVTGSDYPIREGSHRKVEGLWAKQSVDREAIKCPFLFRGTGCAYPELYKNTGALNPQKGIALTCDTSCHKKVLAILSHPALSKEGKYE